jgi:hypothetical protein
MMKKLTDEEIQKLLDSKSATIPSDLAGEAKLYELVFAELNKEPDFRLPEDFSYKVTGKIWQQNSEEKRVTPNLLLVISIVSALLISTGVMLYLNNTVITNLVTLLLDYKWIVLFGLIILALVEACDRLLVRRRST